MQPARSNPRTTPLRSDESTGRKVLLAINGTDFGGSETLLLQLAVGLDRRGFEVHVLSLKTPGHIGDRVREHGIPLHTLDMGEGVSLASAFRAVWKLSRWLRESRFDVIHGNMPRANIMTRISNRLSGSRSPHLSSEHSTDYMRSRLVSRLNGLTARWTDAFLAVSEPVRQGLIDRDGIAEGKILLLGNGVDLDALDALPSTAIREELGLSQDAFVFCTAARLIRDKGHVYLLRALKQITERGADAHLVLIGEGPEEAILIREVAELELSDRVHLVGFRNDVVGILKSVDAFVLPSLEEGIPLVLIEAMACSLPCIATTVGGIRDMLGSESAGSPGETRDT